ncbi:phosphoribosyltransferase [Pyrinomonas sp.]|uniref:phosphoribosyltransferase n=1 Tax=Pyrinomonas sp. TaxID=2080306 RepID=UPI003323B094
MLMRFRDRKEAGRLLAERLAPYAGRPDLVVLALPRGGVPVGREVARALGAPLDVFVVRKLGVPGQEELAMGAIASGGVRVLNEDVITYLGIPPEVVDAVTLRELRELERRERLYRGAAPPLRVAGRTVILVDDGLATGASMRAAVAALGRLHPKEIIVAVPVAAPATCESFQREMGVECVAVMMPEPFNGVGQWYEDFSQMSDDEVRALLEEAREDLSGESSRDRP